MLCSVSVPGSWIDDSSIGGTGSSWIIVLSAFFFGVLKKP